MEIVKANFPEIFNKFVEYEKGAREKGYSADKTLYLSKFTSTTEIVLGYILILVS